MINCMKLLDVSIYWLEQMVGGQSFVTCVTFRWIVVDMTWHWE